MEQPGNRRRRPPPGRPASARALWRYRHQSRRGHRQQRQRRQSIARVVQLNGGQAWARRWACRRSACSRCRTRPAAPAALAARRRACAQRRHGSGQRHERQARSRRTVGPRCGSRARPLRQSPFPGYAGRALDGPRRIGPAIERQRVADRATSCAPASRAGRARPGAEEQRGAHAPPLATSRKYRPRQRESETIPRSAPAFRRSAAMPAPRHRPPALRLAEPHAEVEQRHQAARKTASVMAVDCR